MIDFSIIIANYNDGDLCETLLSSLYDTDLVGCEKNYEIIIVNDGSDEGFYLSDGYMVSRNVIVLNRNMNLGVGDAFDYGVSKARGEYVVLMGADVIVDDKGWIERAIKDFNENVFLKHGIMCFVNQPSNEEYKHLLRYGADIVWKMDGLTLSDKHRSKDDVTYRDIIQGRWMAVEPKETVSKVPCLMGAVYLTTKVFYDYVRGFCGHRVWGGLEPMISLKAWLSGGTVVINKNIVTHHSFMRGNRIPDLHNYYANKIFIAQTTLKTYQAKELTDYFSNIIIRKEEMKMSRSYLHLHRDLVNYLGEILCYDVRDIEILHWGE